MHNSSSNFILAIKVKSVQRPGTEAIRTQIQHTKPNREITKITNSQTYGQPSEQLFPKYPKPNYNNMNTHNVKRHRNFDTKTGNKEAQQNYRLGTVGNELLEGLNMFNGTYLALSF